MFACKYTANNSIMCKKITFYYEKLLYIILM